MFIVEMIIFMIFLVLLVASPNYFWLVVFLFGLGIALGCDYPTAHLIISESIPSSMRGRLVLGAFGFQALGAMTGTVVGYLVLKNIPETGAWRWMYATAVIPALIVTIGRFSITESAHWLLVRGRRDEARTQLVRLLARWPTYPKSVEFTTPVATAGSRQSFLALFDKTNLRATVLASVTWFLPDLGTYGIGIFTPTILAASIGHKTAHVRSLADLISTRRVQRPQSRPVCIERAAVVAAYRSFSIASDAQCSSVTAHRPRKADYLATRKGCPHV